MRCENCNPVFDEKTKDQQRGQMVLGEIAQPAKKQDNQQEIIEAAAHCFMRHGLEKATMTDIADHLGATKGRVYHHFRSKNAVFFAVYRQAMVFCFDAVEPLMAQDLPAADRLFRMAEAHAHVMMDTLPYQRSIRIGVEIYLRGSTTEADRTVLRELIEMRNRYEHLFREVLAEGQADGSLSVTDVPLAGRALIGALNGLVDWFRIRPDQPQSERDHIARTLSATILDGLRS